MALKIEFLNYDGLVYDLQVAGDHSFIANGIIVHNCTMLPIVPGFDPIKTETGEEWFNRQTGEVQKQVMGPGKYEAWRAGKFQFNQLATVKPNKVWGPSAQVTPLKDLLKGRGGFTPPALPKPKPKPSLPSLPLTQPGPSPLPALDHDALEQLDLHALGPNWGQQLPYQQQSYGGIIFNEQGQVLLRKPKNNFDGLFWTFPKGKMDSASEHPVQTALREVEQETGHAGAITGLVPGQYKGTTGAINFFLMKSSGFDKSKMDLETEDLIWAEPAEAVKLIKQGKNKQGIDRDLKILSAAVVAHDDLLTGISSNDHLFAKVKTPKPAIITIFSNPLIRDLEKQAGFDFDIVETLDNIKQNGKGLTVLDQSGKMKAIVSYDDVEDKYLSVTGIWGDTQTSNKTVIINAGKLAAKLGKGIIIESQLFDTTEAALKLGFEPGGAGKDFPEGTYYLPPEWVKQWSKAPTKFAKNKPPLPKSPPVVPTYDRISVTGLTPVVEDLAQVAAQSLLDPLAKKGAGVAFDKIKSGQKGLVYDKEGRFKGVISYEDQGGVIKVGSAGFADFDANLIGLKDVVKIAKQGGKDLVTFAPAGAILDQYKKWGFEVNQTYGNGASLILKKGNFDDWLKDPVAYGQAKPAPKAVAAPSPVPTPTAPPQPASPTGFKATPKPKTVEAIPATNPLPEPADFPDDPNSLTHVRNLGGSTGAELVKAPDGKLYVRKTGASNEHITEECHADAAYMAAGANVPRFRLYSTSSGPVKLAEFIEGESLGDVLKKGGAKASKARKAAQELFAADALFSNRDAVGLSYDNMIVDKKGQVWRVDNGGSFRYRAQGMRKTDFDEYPTDYWTMRDGAVNPQTTDVFGKLDFYAISDQVLELQKRRKAILAAVPAEIQDTLARRMDNIRDMATTAKAMQPDKFKVEYADGFSRQRMEIRHMGLSEQMPLAMDIDGYSKATARQIYSSLGIDTNAVYDEQGRKFDRLRGPNSLVTGLRGLINKAGGDFDLVSNWAQDQAGSSWSSRAQAFKYFLTEKWLSKADNLFWWRDGKTVAQKHFQTVVNDEAVYERTFMALHAFTQELLAKMDFPNKNDVRGTVTILRSEHKNVLGQAGLKPGDRNVTMQRGAVESTSIFGGVYIGTSELTRQEVPLHRVIAPYFMEQSPGSGYGMFAGDGENEFVVILGGDVAFDYVASGNGSTIHIQP